MKHTLRIIISTIFMVITFQQKSVTADGEKKSCKEWVELKNEVPIWKAAYIRYITFPLVLVMDPDQFCELFGKNLPKTEYVSKVTDLPCHKWILYNGYSEENKEENKIIAQSRDANNLDAYVSDYAFLYGKAVLGKYLLGKYIHKQGNKGPLKPLEYCTQILGLTAEMDVESDFNDRALLKRSFPELTKFIFNW